MITVGVLTISDRSSQGIRTDLSGPVLQDAAKNQGWLIKKTGVVPDDFDTIRDILIDWCDVEKVDLILTTGGTGFSPRDITPEATLKVIQKNAPGIAEGMRWESLKITPHAMLSRGIAGIRGQTIIINLPGSPKAAGENFNHVIPVIPHAVELLKEVSTSESGHQFKK